MKPGQVVTIHYAAANHAPDPRWRDIQGIVRVVSRPRGAPRNVLVETEAGTVVVPRWNVRRVNKNE